MSTDGPEERPQLAEVAPDNFLDTWGASSYEEALERAEDADTTTPESELPRCPECESKRVKKRNAAYKDQLRKNPDLDYKCTNCRNYFDEPVYLDPDEDRDPFVWVDPDDLAEPPLDRQLAALDDETLAALAIYCYQPWSHTEADPSYRELARIFPYSRDWVGERVREWKRGQHREKVADPRPPLTTAAGTQGVAAE